MINRSCGNTGDPFTFKKQLYTSLSQPRVDIDKQQLALDMSAPRKPPHSNPVWLPSLALTSRRTCVAYKLGAACVGTVSWESWRLPSWPAEGRGAPRPITKESAGRRTERSLWSRNEEEARGAFKALPGDVTRASSLCRQHTDHTPISEISGCCHFWSVLVEVMA